MIPTAEQTARAIVAAFREVGLPVTMAWRISETIPRKATRNRGSSVDKIRHARGYVALALREAFPKCPSPAIGRMVGALVPGAYLGTILAYRAKGKLVWYDPESLRRVVEAIGDIPQNGKCDGAVTQERAEPASDQVEKIDMDADRPVFECPDCGKDIADDTEHGLNCPRHPANEPEPAPREPAGTPDDPIDLPELPKRASWGTMPLSLRRRPTAMFDGGHRRRAEDMLREAVLNTGGRLVEDDSGE